MCNNIETSFMIKNNAQQFALYLSIHYTQDSPEMSKKLHGKLCFTGLEINEKFQSQFCGRIPKFSRNLATFARKIFKLHFPINALAKQNTSP